ncbi:MAG: hypothetical protein RJA41_424, partial [Actinomycetota bacterium]
MALTRFRNSLFLKVFTLSGLVSIALIYFLGSNLYDRISAGIIEEKISASISEGESAIQYAEYRFLVSGVSSSVNYKELVAEIVNSKNISARDSGREVVLLQSADREIKGVPAVTTSNFLRPESIPSELRKTVSGDEEIHWQQSTLKYVNGESLQGVVIGKSVK